MNRVHYRVGFLPGLAGLLLSGLPAQDVDPLDQARALGRDGKPAAAIALAQQVVARDAQRYDAWAVLAWAKMRADDLDSVDDALAQAVALAPAAEAKQITMLAQQLTGLIESRRLRESSLEQAKAHRLAERYVEAGEAYTVAWRTRREEWRTLVAALQAWQLAQRVEPRAVLLRELRSAAATIRIENYPELQKAIRATEQAVRRLLTERLDAARSALKKRDFAATEKILQAAAALDPDDRKVAALHKQLRKQRGDRAPTSTGKYGVIVGGRASRGGSKAHARAIERGIQWLVAQQQPDGRWQAGQDGRDVWVTGLVLLACLADSSTLSKGPWREPITRAVPWLLAQQDDRGLFVSDGSLLDNAVAVWALCEACGLSQAEQLQLPARRAVAALRAQQLPGGGWPAVLSSPRADPAVTGWAMLAIETSSHFEFVESMVKQRQQGLAWFKDQTDPTTGLVSVTDGGSGVVTPSDAIGLTGLALFVRLFSGQHPHDVPIMLLGLKAIVAAKPPATPASWLFCSHTTYQFGGSVWRDWLKRQQQVIRRQRASGGNAGSWDPTGPLTDGGGRISTTAMMVQALQSYYRYGILLR